MCDVHNDLKFTQVTLGLGLIGVAIFLSIASFFQYRDIRDLEARLDNQTQASLVTDQRLLAASGNKVVVYMFSTPEKHIYLGTVPVSFTGYEITPTYIIATLGLFEDQIGVVGPGERSSVRFSDVFRPGDLVIAWIADGFISSENNPWPISPIQAVEASYWSSTSGLAVAILHIDGSQEQKISALK